ncbi:MAG: peroxiredoxin [Alphaproteobacteria bacterium]|nr:peroxiredoxin [Alphaproteobacteria bacterium]
MILNATDKNGNIVEFNEENLKGNITVLYFYPKDNTSGCTKEACDFRDNMNRLTVCANVIGVSPDSVASHQKFQQKQNLNFMLVADINHKLSEKYGVWKEKSMYGRKYMGIERSTFIIDESGKIIKEWRKVKVTGHVDEVLTALASL